MAKTTNNLRTASQNRRLHFLLGRLNIPADVKNDYAYLYSNGRTERTSELMYVECQRLVKDLEKLLQTHNRQTVSERVDDNGTETDRKKLDRLRKGVLKAIFRWYELQNRQVTIEYVKATACQAAQCTNFNKISPAALTRIYNEFCRKQRVLHEKEDMHINVNLN